MKYRRYTQIRVINESYEIKRINRTNMKLVEMIVDIHKYGRLLYFVYVCAYYTYLSDSMNCDQLSITMNPYMYRSTMIPKMAR